MFLLRVRPAESEPFDHELVGDALDIGRSTHCDITIADRFLSRRHARLTRNGDNWQIDDLGSRNGTFINGRRIDQPAEIKVGDSIALSASVINVEPLPSAGSPSDEPRDSPTTDRLLRSAVEVLRRSGTPPPPAEASDPDFLGRYAARLALLNEVHQAMARSVGLDDLLELILDHIFAQLRPERAEVFMRCDEGGYTCVASRSAPRTSLRSLYSENLFSEVVGKTMAALVTDARSDHRFAQAESLVSAGVRSLLAAPLYASDAALGLIVLGSNAAVRQFSEEDLELLVTLSSVAALRIHNLALSQEAAERHRLERELTIARNLQVALIPERLPHVGGYRFFGATKPSRGVSGDYYQLVERAGGDEFVLALADVSGKGISAALLTGYLEAVSSVPIENGDPPHEIFNRVSRKLHDRTPPNRFATMFLGVLAPSTASVRYASAGHSPACLIRSSGVVEWLGSTGLPLGLMPDNEYELGRTTLEIGDTLVVYSDGYTEAENPQGEEFGQDRLAEVCLRHLALEPEALANEVDRALESYAAGRPFADDRTIVVVRRVG
ncbi:MAG: SpoIIE family protein phosphatase [Candidatus Sulfomarinibacteraceae bacterium]